jgi:hypothetical protein
VPASLSTSGVAAGLPGVEPFRNQRDDGSPSQASASSRVRRSAPRRRRAAPRAWSRRAPTSTRRRRQPSRSRCDAGRRSVPRRAVTRASSPRILALSGCGACRPSRWRLRAGARPVRSRLMELCFAEVESTFDYLRATRRSLERHGKPMAFYSDRLSVFHVQARDRAQSGPGLSQFGRACQALNIDLLCANSPEAKGYASYCTSSVVSCPWRVYVDAASPRCPSTSSGRARPCLAAPRDTAPCRYRRGSGAGRHVAKP